MAIDFISDHKSFLKIKQQIDACSELAGDRNAQYEIYKINSLAFQGYGFISLVQILSEAGKNREFTFLTVDPDPTTFFFSKIGIYPAVTFQCTVTEENYLSTLMDGPLRSDKYSLSILSDAYYVLANNLSWFIFGRRFPTEETFIYVKCGMVNTEKLDTTGWIQPINWTTQQLPNVKVVTTFLSLDNSSG